MPEREARTNIDHDPAHMTPEEREETARSEGLMATEEETDPTYVDPGDGEPEPPQD
jgi:hypothetical protein